jgi:DNA-3-methyladenine glycosylase I
MCQRCEWVTDDPVYIAYHDEEWGVPVYDDRKLFEMLILEGAQAGLSWITVLKRREGYRRAFDQFDPAMIATYDERKIEALLHDTGIIRNRLKVLSAVKNARGTLDIIAEHGSLQAYLWAFVDGAPIQNAWPSLAEIPTETATSKAMSKALKKRGFSFVGPTICYAFIQACGMVNDHITDCHRYPVVRAIGTR